MIYNSTITAMNESDILSLLENAEDRFENYTIAEATAIIVREQEINWNRLMTGIGMSELATVMEGQEVIYEGARLEGFLKKVKAFFQAALNKLAELTKRFIAKIDQIFKANDSFVKKYKKDLVNITIPSDFEFKGYTFKHMETPQYEMPTGISTTLKPSDVKDIVEHKDRYSKETVLDSLTPGTSGDSLNDRLIEYFYGSNEKQNLGNIKTTEQLNILSTTKDMKKKAKDSYTKAAKEIRSFIKELERAEKTSQEEYNKYDRLQDGMRIDQAYNLVIGFWKIYANGASQKHGTYMRALGARTAQAKAICTKLLSTKYKSDNKKKEESKAKNEGFVNTEDFLGAVEFI